MVMRSLPGEVYIRRGRPGRRDGLRGRHATEIVGLVPRAVGEGRLGEIDVQVLHHLCCQIDSVYAEAVAG